MGPLCPSAPPDQDGAQVLGVVRSTERGPRVGYLNAHQPVTDEILAAAGPVDPRQVIRVAAPCQENRCSHHDGQTCSLAARIVQTLTPVGDSLPPCVIRRRCRWYLEQGAPACHRCPQVVTQVDAHATPAALLNGADGAPLAFEA